MKNILLTLLTLLATTTLAAQAEVLTPGLELGVQAGHYRYNETPKFMELESTPSYAVTGAYQGQIAGYNLRLEGRLMNAEADYWSGGTGTADGEKNWLAEGRILNTYSTSFLGIDLAPYWGYGYRYLRNDGENTSTGALGYTRESQYHYLPVGTWAELPLNLAGLQGSLVGQLEYGQLLYGKQLSAIGSGIENTQTDGTHLRFFAGYRTGNWQVGPYGQFWHVKDSDTGCNTTGTCGYEPNNYTREVGLQASYHF